MELIYGIENSLKKLKKEITQLREENTRLRKRDAELGRELIKVRSRNNNLQDIINDYRKTVPSISPLKSVHVPCEILSNGDVKYNNGIVLTVSQQRILHNFKSSDDIKKFINNLLLMVFDEDVLRNSSVTGRKTNRFKGCSAKPALSIELMHFVCELTREHWPLTTLGFVRGVTCKKIMNLNQKGVLKRVNTEEPQSEISEKMLCLQDIKVEEDPLNMSDVLENFSEKEENISEGDFSDN